MTTAVLSALLCFYSASQVKICFTNTFLDTHHNYVILMHAVEKVIIMYTANCADGVLRLVGGRDTDRKGRVEVCVNNRWRTVCTGSQEVAGAVCSQMGYIFEGNTVD